MFYNIKRTNVRKRDSHFAKHSLSRCYKGAKLLTIETQLKQFPNFTMLQIVKK
nr:MAG TPA: hypothetical protein [Bacteriophage sp.]